MSSGESERSAAGLTALPSLERLRRRGHHGPRPEAAVETQREPEREPEQAPVAREDDEPERET